DDVGAGNLRSCQETVHVRCELVRILLGWPRSAPTVSRAVEGADPGLARDIALHPCPARRSFSQPVEQDHGRRARTCTAQVEAVAVDGIGATAEWGGVARRRFRDGLEYAAKGDEREQDEGGVEEGPSRPVME